jgi:hypothetical protein
MRNKIRRGLVLAALAGTCVMAIAPDALAAPTTPATVSPEGIAAYATGVVPLGPLGVSNSGSPNGSDSGTPVGTLLTLGALTSSVNGNTTMAEVATLSDTGIISTLGPISAGAITSFCTANADGTFDEGASVVNLNILGNNIGTLTNPTPEVITTGFTGLLTGIANVTVYINQQVAGPVTGSQTDNAVVITFTILGVAETIYLASSTCGPYSSSAASPLAGGTGLGVGLGLLGLAGIGMATVYVRRRNGYALR